MPAAGSSMSRSRDGQDYPHGSRAPYLITLRIARVRVIGTIRFARRITATYLNAQRSDATRCPLAPSHDPPLHGPGDGGLPTTPVASFAARAGSERGVVQFRGRSRPGRGERAASAGRLGTSGTPARPTGTPRRVAGTDHI